MPLNTKDLREYRRDEKYGHKLMTAEERIRLLKVSCVAIRKRYGT